MRFAILAALLAGCAHAASPQSTCLVTPPSSPTVIGPGSASCETCGRYLCCTLGLPPEYSTSDAPHCKLSLIGDGGLVTCLDGQEGSL